MDKDVVIELKMSPLTRKSIALQMDALLPLIIIQIILDYCKPCLTRFKQRIFTYEHNQYPLLILTEDHCHILSKCHEGKNRRKVLSIAFVNNEKDRNFEMDESTACSDSIYSNLIMWIDDDLPKKLSKHDFNRKTLNQRPCLVLQKKENKNDESSTSASDMLIKVNANHKKHLVQMISLQDSGENLLDDESPPFMTPCVQFCCCLSRQQKQPRRILLERTRSTRMLQTIPGSYFSQWSKYLLIFDQEKKKHKLHKRWQGQKLDNVTKKARHSCTRITRYALYNIDTKKSFAVHFQADLLPTCPCTKSPTWFHMLSIDMIIIDIDAQLLLFHLEIDDTNDRFCLARLEAIYDTLVGQYSMALRGAVWSSFTKTLYVFQERLGCGECAYTVEVEANCLLENNTQDIAIDNDGKTVLKAEHTDFKKGKDCATTSSTANRTIIHYIFYTSLIKFTAKDVNDLEDNYDPLDSTCLTCQRLALGQADVYQSPNRRFMAIVTPLIYDNTNMTEGVQEETKVKKNKSCQIDLFECVF